MCACVCRVWFYSHDIGRSRAESDQQKNWSEKNCKTASNQFIKCCSHFWSDDSVVDDYHICLRRLGSASAAQLGAPSIHPIKRRNKTSEKNSNFKTQNQRSNQNKKPLHTTRIEVSPINSRTPPYPVWAMSKSSSTELHFRKSLRDAANNKSPPCNLHRGCSGHLHGQGVLKVKSKVDPAPCQRSVARDTRSSSQSPIAYERTAYSSRETDDSCYNSSSDVESTPTRKKSMLGLGRVLAPAPESKCTLPPRVPPKFLAFSTRSLSSSTCSSDQSSSSRYSGSPSPGIHDQYNSSLQWPFSVASASSGLFLEEVSEEPDGDLDQWAEHHRLASTSPCSTLASSTYESSIDQGRRLAMSPHQLRHSTPNRSPNTERNRTATSNSTTPPIRRPVVSNNNRNNTNGPGLNNKVSTVESKKKTITNTAPLIKNKRVADLKSNGHPLTSRSLSPSLSRRNSAASSRSSVSSQTPDASTRRPIRTSTTLNTNNITNNKQGNRPVVNSTTRTKTTHSSLANNKISNQKTGLKQQQRAGPVTPPTPKEDDEVVKGDSVPFLFIFLFKLRSIHPQFEGSTCLRRAVISLLDGRSSSLAVSLFPYGVRKSNTLKSMEFLLSLLLFLTMKDDDGGLFVCSCFGPARPPSSPAVPLKKGMNGTNSCHVAKRIEEIR